MLLVSGDIWQTEVVATYRFMKQFNLNKIQKNKDWLRILCNFLLHKLYMCTLLRETVEHCDIFL